MNNIIGTEKLNKMLTKVVNLLINEYIKKTSTIDYDFNFDVKVRKSQKDTPFVGCNAGSRGEPYSYVVEVYSDIGVPKSFVYDEEYKKKHNKIGRSYHYSIVENEIKNLLPLIGLDTHTLGNVFGVCFMNLI
jgi:hypothetical protein